MVAARTPSVWPRTTTRRATARRVWREMRTGAAARPYASARATRATRPPNAWTPREATSASARLITSEIRSGEGQILTLYLLLFVLSYYILKMNHYYEYISNMEIWIKKGVGISYSPQNDWINCRKKGLPVYECLPYCFEQIVSWLHGYSECFNFTFRHLSYSYLHDLKKYLSRQI